MPLLATLLCAASLWGPGTSLAQETGYRLVFPPDWSVESRGNLVEVKAEGREAHIVTSTGAPDRALSIDDQGPEVQRLVEEAGSNGLVVNREAIAARIVLTSSNEPMVVLEYEWRQKGSGGASGRGMRLVRSCDTRVVVDERSESPNLPWLTRVTGGVYYHAPACLRYNLDTVSKIVEENPSSEVSAAAGARRDLPEAPPLLDEPAESTGGRMTLWLLLAVLGGALVLLLWLGSKALGEDKGRTRGAHPPRRVPDVPHPAAPPSRESPTGGYQGLKPTEARRSHSGVKELDFRAKAEPVAGTGSATSGEWGINEARPAPERAPRAAPIPEAGPHMPIGTYNMRVDPSDPRRRLENALMKLGAEAWLDCVNPGILSPASLQAPLIDLLRIQNGARYGRGWLVLLGVDRENTDIRVINQDPVLKERMGEGTCFGITCFGDALFLTPDNRVELRLFTGGRRELGHTLVETLEDLGKDPEARKRLADPTRYERFRSFLGDLPPGNVYVEMGGEDLASTTVATSLPFLEALKKR